MKFFPVLLLCVMCLFSKTAKSQSFEKCEKILTELLPEFNRAFEEQNPQLLQSKAYQKKLKRLKSAFEAYEKNSYASEDSVSRANNEAIMLALSGSHSKAIQKIASTERHHEKLMYHKGLIGMMLGDYDASYSLLSQNSAPGAQLNAFVSQGNARKSTSIEKGIFFSAGATDPKGKMSYNQGVVHRRYGNTEAALAHFNKALEKQENDVYRIQRGDTFLDSGLPEKALVDYSAISRRHPAGLVKKGNALLQLHQFSEAISLFKRYLNSTNQEFQGEAYLGIANAFYGEGSYAEARAYYELAARYRPLTTTAQCGLANVALSENKYVAAQRIYDRLIQADTSFLEAYLGRAIAKYGSKNYFGALEDFEKSGPLIDRSNVEMADVLVCRGYSFYHIGDQQSAQRDFENAVKLDARRFEALAGLGKIEIDRRKFSEAGKYLSEALRHQKEHDRLWANYGNLLLHFGMFDKAYAVFKNAVSINPKNLHARNGQGITLLERDKLKESKSLFDSLLRTNPGRPFLLNNRGIVHAYLGNRFSQNNEQVKADHSYTMAEKDFNRAMENAPARKFYNVNKGNVFRYWEQYEEARLSYQSYQDKSALNNTAVLLAGLERLKDARYYLGVALQIDSTHRVFQYNKSVLTQGKAKEMARLVASTKDNGPYSEISLKYSLDGYVTIYLYDYEYEEMEFPGRHHLSLPYRNFDEGDLIPEYDFSFLPYSGNKKEVQEKRKPIRMPKNKQKGRSKSGTQCPVLF